MLEGFRGGTAAGLVPAELDARHLGLDPRIRNQLRCLRARVLVADADLFALRLHAGGGCVALRGGDVDLGGTSRAEGGLTLVGLS